MKTRKQEYINRMARELREWSATIDEYEADASRMGVGFQEEFARTVRDLKEKRDLLASRLRELEGETGDAWISLQTGVKKAMHDLTEAFAQAGAVMKKAS